MDEGKKNKGNTLRSYYFICSSFHQQHFEKAEKKKRRRTPLSCSKLFREKEKEKKNNFINEINNMKTEHNPYRIANR